MTRSKGQTKPRRNKKDKTVAKSVNKDDDERFLDLAKNPMFREQKRKERKIVVDDRFKQMLSDKRFDERDFRVDKRGKPIRKTGDNFLNRLYEFDEGQEGRKSEESDNGTEENDDQEDVDEEKEKPDEDGGENEDEDQETSGDEEEESSAEEDLPQIQLDLARGEGPILSSSEDEEEEDGGGIGDDDVEMEAEQLDEADKDIRRVEWASSRLAVCNMDWTKLTAEDLMMVLNSFKSSTGSIQSVAIYLSDFGAERLREEKDTGPRLKLKPAKKGTGNLEERTKQAIRAYEQDRFRYYYAVCECDSVQTATAIYEECDGVEYEASGIRFDLRFIPEEMKFEENQLRDRITSDELSGDKNYKPKRITTHSVLCSNPKITWEEPDHERKHKMRDAFEQEAKLEEFESMIAPGSDEEDEESQKRRYDTLIAAAREEEEAGKMFAGTKDVDEEEMEGEMTREEGKEVVGIENEREESESDWDEEEERRGRGKTNKKTNFQIYLERKKQLKTERKQKEQEKRKTVKRKRMGGELDQSVEKDGHLGAEQVECDERFSAFFKDSAFAIDQTKAEYKGGDLAKRQVYGKMKRRGEKQSKIGGEDETMYKIMKDESNEPVGHKEEEATDILVQRLKKKQKQRQKEGMVE